MFIKFKAAHFVDVEIKNAFFSKTDNDNNNNNYNDDDATSNIINLSISLMNFFTIRIPVQSILKILKERFPHTIYNIH